MFTESQGSRQTLDNRLNEVEKELEINTQEAVCLLQNRFNELFRKKESPNESLRNRLNKVAKKLKIYDRQVEDLFYNLSIEINNGKEFSKEENELNQVEIELGINII